MLFSLYPEMLIYRSILGTWLSLTQEPPRPLGGQGTSSRIEESASSPLLLNVTVLWDSLLVFMGNLKYCMIQPPWGLCPENALG